MFPLVSRPGGVLTRSGHTEAATDLARLAGQGSVGVLAEIVNDDGSLKRLPELVEFAKAHGLKIVSIEGLIEHRIRTEHFVERVASRPARLGDLEATLHVYQTPFDPMQHLVAVFGELGDGEAVPCRIHREQPLGDLVARAGRSRSWLDAALDRFRAEGRGVLVLLRNPSAEDPGLGEDGAGEPEGDGLGGTHGSARRRTQRWREVGLGAQILRHMGVRSITLLTSREQHYVGLSGFGIEIARTVRVVG